MPLSIDASRLPRVCQTHAAVRGYQSMLIGVVCLLPCAVGCWDGGYAEVTGTVRIDGQPLAGAFVVFTPETAGEARGLGTTDVEGRYRVMRPARKIGAALGRNSVRIAGGDGGRDIPAKYGTASELTFDVTSGRNVFDIDIVTK